MRITRQRQIHKSMWSNSVFVMTYFCCPIKCIWFDIWICLVMQTQKQQLNCNKGWTGDLLITLWLDIEHPWTKASNTELHHQTKGTRTLLDFYTITHRTVLCFQKIYFRSQIIWSIPQTKNAKAFQNKSVIVRL